MKRIFTLSFAVISVLSVHSQTYIQDGDSCFTSCDYTCAITNYDIAFKNTMGKDKQIAEIKLTRAKWCAEHIKTADLAFFTKKHLIAKEEYQKVLDSNPKDSFAQSQIIKCDYALNPTKLRKATTADLTDIWNNKYGVKPQRSQNLIDAGIDPDDAQKRINAGEGKPQDAENAITNLSLSKSNLYFTSKGEIGEPIYVYTDASTYSIPQVYIPLWCAVKTYSGYFTVTASANPDTTIRKDWFKVIAGGKEVRINVEQFAKTIQDTQPSISSPKEKTQSIDKSCFNCPKTHDTWGLTLGYIQQTIDYYTMDFIQLGLKVEPLFRYGLGLNTGINIMGYSRNLSATQILDYGFDTIAVNIPLHLEYRLNFSKWFNFFVYGGVGFNIITDSNFDNYSLPATCEYGGGFRISHIQVNVGKNLYLGNLRSRQNYGNNLQTYQKLILSISYMF